MQKPKPRPLSHPSNPRTRYKEPEQHTGEMFMTEKVFLLAAKWTQNSCSPPCLCVLCAKKQIPNCDLLVALLKPLMREKVFRSRIKPVPLQMRPARSANCAWRIMAQNGGLCRDCGGFCRTMWRIMADFVVSMWRKMADFVVSMWRKMADFVGFCRTMWRIMAQNGGFYRANAPL